LKHSRQIKREKKNGSHYAVIEMEMQESYLENESGHNVSGRKKKERSMVTLGKGVSSKGTFVCHKRKEKK